MTINSIDVTLICLNAMGVVLFISYLVFAYLVTHKGDFYRVRRWKAALWFAGLPGLVLLAFLLFPSISTIVINSSGKNVIGMIGLGVAEILSTLTFIIPLLFIISIGTHYQLKWWLNSDDFLDKIWKDPNKGHKSPIQEL